jgi:transcriptional regulator with XRE-family HTH domain
VSASEKPTRSGELIAETLRIYRATRRWNQSRLGALLGVSRDRVARIEAGHPIRPDELKRLLALLQEESARVGVKGDRDRR